MSHASARPTLGFLSTWSVYQGATIDNYTHTLLQGISTGARELECNLLLGCGIGLAARPRASRTAWAVPDTDVDFVPVGPWNTDGLIVIPDDLSPPQFAYLQELIQDDFPIVLTTAEKPGLATHRSHLVAVDNAGGVRAAMHHLLHHGHRQIAFIAGKSGHGGDTAERFTAYRESLGEAGIAYDARLTAYGEHRTRDGRAAMQQILNSGVEFTALLASNDLSCLGATQTLREAGRRIPQDVAVISFDDILEARSQLSPLTTVRHPTFAQGYQSVVTLLDTLAGHAPEVEIRIPTRLVVRQSCGCRPESAASENSFASNPDLQARARAMAQATLVEARISSEQDIQPLCLALAQAYDTALARRDTAPFERALSRLALWVDAHDEDAFAWHAAISALDCPTSPLAHTLIDRARLEIAEHTQRQATDMLLKHMDMSGRLGLMTAQLLAAPEMLEGATPTQAEDETNSDLANEHAILAEHLPHLGITHALVAAYVPRPDDPYACANVLLDAGMTHPFPRVGQEFSTRAFPPRDFYPNTPFQLVLMPLVIDARPTGFVALALDTRAPLTNLEACAAITHNLGSALRSSRLYRDALLGRRLAEQANKLKSRFLSTVSHELRTPLSLIVGLSDMVLEQHDGALPGSARRDLEQIHTSARHLGRLMSDVLDLASSEAGQLRLQMEPFELTHEFTSAARIGAQMARDKNLEWRAHCRRQDGLDSSDASSQLWVNGDRTRVRQIILNLLSNAVKFTPNGTVTLDLKTEGQTATISVSDTGIGIAPDEQLKLFREFQRTERTIAAGYGGLGLGLAISKQLVEQHGGAIGVRSPGDLGSGSTFYFTLPLVREPPEGDLEHDFLACAPGAQEFRPFSRAFLDPFLAPGSPDAPRTVLVVDDDPAILALHARLVEQQGHRAVLAHNGRQALELIESTHPSLVLLDLMMPELDGFHVLDALRARETTRAIPVIVLTARALDETDIERLNRGVAAIMAKGLFRTGEMVKHIQAALERRHALGSPTQRLVRRAMGFIHARYADPLTREQIAAHVNINPDYLTDCFRQEVGVTPMVYLNRYRLKQARELLENSDLKITQIALAVGFGESAHFTRMFQRETGVTPRAWRQGKRK